MTVSTKSPITSVLVAVDFSPASRLAVNYGVAAARLFRARLSLLNVVDAGADLASATIEKQQCSQAMKILPALVSPEDQDDLDLKILVKTGNVEEAILTVIEKEHFDLLVMGTHGRGLVKRWLIGSVAQSILRRVHIPILTVCRVAQPLTMSRILFATDLSASSRQGFRRLLKIAGATKSTLVIAHTVERVSLTLGGAEMATHVEDYLLREAREGVDELAAEARSAQVKVETVVLEGIAAEAIFKAASDNAADLIAITVQRKGALERALLGSTAERVIRESALPVLSIPVNGSSSAQQ